MATKYKRIVDTTTNNRVYKIALKHYREVQGIISCAICPYHRHENIRYHDWRKRNWKHYRKTQYKVKVYDVYGE
jgi:hypothetical protein